MRRAKTCKKVQAAKKTCITSKQDRLVSITNPTYETKLRQMLLSPLHYEHSIEQRASLVSIKELFGSQL